MLDQIRDRYEIQAQQWAEAAEMQNPRITELRKKYRNPELPIDRAFSFVKCVALLRGLIKILGGETVAKELQEVLKKIKDQDQRLILEVLYTISKGTKADKDQVELFLRTVNRKHQYNKSRTYRHGGKRS